MTCGKPVFTLVARFPDICRAPDQLPARLSVRALGGLFRPLVACYSKGFRINRGDRMNSTTNQGQAARSSFVTIIAWIFMALNGLSTLVLLGLNILFNTLLPVEEVQRYILNNEGGQIPPAAEFFVSHLGVMLGALLAGSVVQLATAIALLRRKNWGRLLFIFFLGMGIVWNIASVLMQDGVLTPLPPPPPDTPPDFAGTFKTMMMVGIVFSVGYALAFSGLFAWIIKRLLSPEISREFAVVPQKAAD